MPLFVWIVLLRYVIHDSEKLGWDYFDWDEAEVFEQLMPTAESALGYLDIMDFNSALCKYLNSLSKEDLIERLRDSKAVPYMPRVMEHLINNYRRRKALAKLLESTQRVPDVVNEEIERLATRRADSNVNCHLEAAPTTA